MHTQSVCSMLILLLLILLLVLLALALLLLLGIFLWRPRRVLALELN